MLFHNMSSSGTTGNSSAAYTQYFTEDTGLQLQIKVSAFPSSAHSDSGAGDDFRGLTTVRWRYDLLLCLPSLSELTGFLSSHRGRLLPSFRRIGHPHRRRISLQCQLGNLHWRDFHPLDHQLASLHNLTHPQPIRGGGHPGSLHFSRGQVEKKQNDEALQPMPGPHLYCEEIGRRDPFPVWPGIELSD
jgi:hypothetical protein